MILLSFTVLVVIDNNGLINNFNNDVVLIANQLKHNNEKIFFTVFTRRILSFRISLTQSVRLYK